MVYATERPYLKQGRIEDPHCTVTFTSPLLPTSAYRCIDIYTKVHTQACTHTNMSKSLKKYTKIVVKYE